MRYIFKLLFFALMLTAGVAKADTDTVTVVVVPYQGQNTVLTKVRSIVFSGNNVLFYNKQAEELGNKDLETVRLIKFGQASDTIATSVVSKQAGESQYRLYPNPVSSTTTLANLQKDDQIEIYTQHGVLIYTFKASDEQYLLDVSALPQGIYVVSVNGKWATKMIKK